MQYKQRNVALQHNLVGGLPQGLQRDPDGGPIPGPILFGEKLDMAKKAQPNFFDPKNNPFLDPKNNPFLDPEKNPLLNNPMLSKEFGAGIAMPNANPKMVEDLMAAQKSNFEALAEANKTAVEGFQAVFQRQTEILRELTEEATAAAQELSATGAPDAMIAGRIDQVKDLMKQSVSNVREMSEMIAKSQGEAFDILNDRAAENLEELKAAVKTLKA